MGSPTYLSTQLVLLATQIVTLLIHYSRACWKLSEYMLLTLSLSSRRATLLVVSVCICQAVLSDKQADMLYFSISIDAVWEESKESTSLDILEAYAIMRSALNMPVFGTLGNQ